MVELKVDELKAIDGGVVISPLVAFTLVSVGVPFLCGLFDGLVQPLACK